MSNDTSTFLERKAALRAKLEAEGKLNAAAKVQPKTQAPRNLPTPPANSPAESAFDPDLIPDTGVDQYDFEEDIDVLISSIGIMDAYKRWVPGQHVEDEAGRTEGIMCQCPFPSHADEHPSAWINTDKDYWYCGGCAEGGDIYDLAAFYYNLYPYKGVENGRLFHDLRRNIAGEFGYTFQKDAFGKWQMFPPGGEVIEDVVPEEAAAPVAPQPERAPGPVETPPAVPTHALEVPEDNVVSIETGLPPVPPSKIKDTDFEWRNLVDPGTFLYEFADACSEDDIAEEYHFWHGMLGLGLAIGRNVKLFDRRLVTGNLFICILGDSGAGKSRSKEYLDTLIKDTMPFDEGDPSTLGVRSIKSPASGETLISAFVHKIEVPSLYPTRGKPLPPEEFGNVRGIIEFNEFSALVGRAARMGNVLPEVLMEFYDGNEIVATQSQGRGKYLATNPFGCSISSSQPKRLSDLISKSDIDSGFINRWLFITGTEKDRIGVGGAPIDLSPCYNSLHEVRGWAATERTHMWDQDALDRFNQFYRDTIRPLQRTDDDNVATRIDLTMKKLVLLFSANNLEDTASLKSVEQAISCFGYLIRAYETVSHFVGMTEGSEIRDEVERLVAHYETKPSGATRQAIIRHLRPKKWDVYKINRMFDELLKGGLITTIQPPAGSRFRIERYGVAK